MIDLKLDIAHAPSAKRKKWTNSRWTWEKLVNKLSDFQVTHETVKEYANMPKNEQGNIKDVGGFVGGYLADGKRSPQNVKHRQVIALDLDYAELDFWADFTLTFSCAAVLHSTHKHTPKNPRFRLIIPVNRPLTPDEYIAVARKVADEIDIDLFDPTTFQTNRLMYWPSVSKDGERVFNEQKGKALDADEILRSYVNWRDISEWAFAKGHDVDIKKTASKQEDPLVKKGIVGAFCRKYTVKEAIEYFLPSVYSSCGDGFRFTYTEGSTAGGLIVYEDKFAYSHHSTDPCSGKLVNSFDMVRLHKFGALDADYDTEKAITKAPSYLSMLDFAVDIPELSEAIANERLQALREELDVDMDIKEESNTKWRKKLDVDRSGVFKNSAKNVTLIIKNDINFKDKFRFNLFDNKKYVTSDLPWRKIGKPEPIKDVDYSGVRNYIETFYGITATGKIDDALALEFNNASFHPVRDYLSGLEWDGKKRIDNLLIKYFGAEDNEYTKAAMRKTLVGAVSRIFNPGIKFDLVLILIGEQGMKKSSFFNFLAGDWFSDTFLTVHGKESFEQIQGSWIIEISELAGLRKAEVEATKQYLSKREDSFRPAYGREIVTYQRQCIFVGTTNNWEFLKDPTGNRRFLPIAVRPSYVEGDPFSEEFLSSVDQIWAEAMALYKEGETLYLNRSEELIADKMRFAHSETDDRRGIIKDYLDMSVPRNWDEMDIFDRRSYIESGDYSQGYRIRDKVCIAEIWCECLGRNKEEMSRYNTRDINDVMRSMRDWKMQRSPARFSLYGMQKYYLNQEEEV